MASHPIRSYHKNVGDFSVLTPASLFQRPVLESSVQEQKEIIKENKIPPKKLVELIEYEKRYSHRSQDDYINYWRNKGAEMASAADLFDFFESLKFRYEAGDNSKEKIIQLIREDDHILY